MSKRAAVIVLGYGDEPHLQECLEALTAQLGPDDELVLVDNGIARTLPELPRVRRIGDGTNRGFAGGCRRGAAATDSAVLVFVNSDAIVHAGAVPTLVERAEATRGIVGGCLRLADRPDLVNSAGNPLHFLGITWAGHCGEPATAHARPGPVAVATGGLFALPRTLWDELDGFPESYFAYHEDTDLSLRSWLTGQPVAYEPSAAADHHYEFSRTPLKMYLVERNRWQTILADYPAALLVAVAPALVLTEPLLLVMALRQGWGRQKLRAWGWIVAHLGQVLARRRRVQARVTVRVGVVADLLAARIEPPMLEAPPGMGLLNAALAGYWSLARRVLAGRGDRRVGRRGPRRGPASG